MKTDLKERLEKIMKEHNKPTSEDRIAALESAITDIAIMLTEVSSND